MASVAVFATIFTAVGAFPLWRAWRWIRRGKTDDMFRGVVAAARETQPTVFWLQVIGVAVVGAFFASMGLFLMLLALVGLPGTPGLID